MLALVADDDATTVTLLRGALSQWGFSVTTVDNGAAAWATISATHEPLLAVIDWVMPEIDGLEICRRVRAADPVLPVHLLLLTGRNSAADVVAGFDAGADDYLVKPFDVNELRARAHVGRRMLNMQRRLADQVLELQASIARTRHLQGLLPICCYCKRIRSDDDYWQQVEAYIMEHADVTFSHGICPCCFDKAEKEFNRSTEPA